MPIAKKRILIKDFHGDVIARYDSITACARDMQLSPATVKHEADKVRVRKERTNTITYQNQEDIPKKVKLNNVWKCERHQVHVARNRKCPMCEHEQEDLLVKKRIIQQFQKEEGYED